MFENEFYFLVFSVIIMVWAMPTQRRKMKPVPLCNSMAGDKNE